MQLKEHLPFDVRDVFRRLPPNGEVLATFRRFTLNTRVGNRARSVKKFAEELGFAVLETPLPKGMAGRLIPSAYSDNEFLIEVNTRQSVQAHRFATMHEIAHYYLHSDQSDIFAGAEYFDLSPYSFYVDEAKEREANQFAEAMFFGDGQLSAAYSSFGDDMETLAKYFGLNESVIKIALDKLRF